MRTRKERLQRLVCAEHCRFFKPWQQETARCGAYDWLLQRSLASDQILDVLEKLRGERWGTLDDHDAALLRSVCTRCAYYPSACAYRDPARAQGATPCGALDVLRALLTRHAITLEELYDSARERTGEAAAGDD
jgi:hypothetical protein